MGRLTIHVLCNIKAFVTWIVDLSRKKCLWLYIYSDKYGSRSKRPHYQKAPYQNAPTFHQLPPQNAPLFPKLIIIKKIFFVIQMFINVFPRFVFVRIFCFCFILSLLKKTHNPRYCEKQMYKAIVEKLKLW